MASVAIIPVAGQAADSLAQAKPQFTSLHNFSSATGRKAGGASPRGGLLQSVDGSFYGVASEGGANGLGTLYRMTAEGKLRTLVSFTNATGSYPVGELAQDSEGSLYGAAGSGGACTTCGTIFKLTSAGEFSVLHRFSPDSEGYSPNGSLLLAPDGNFYGTTFYGGDFNAGTIFRMTPDGVTTTLHSFGGSFDSSVYPLGGLMRASDGNLYGTTTGGGSTNSGTIYQLAADGSFTTLASFTFSLGRSPHGTLVQGTDGALYGTTTNDGPQNSGTAFRYAADSGLTRIAQFGGPAGKRPLPAWPWARTATSMARRNKVAAATPARSSRCRPMAPLRRSTPSAAATAPARRRH